MICAMNENTMRVKRIAKAAATLGLAPLAVGLLLAVPCAKAQTKEADMKSVEDEPTAVPIQSFESKEQMEFGENLSFTPWHAVADLRPLGGINRARKKVYEAISARRHELNGVPMEEPSLSETSRFWTRSQ
jgi:hypothetical protein